MDTPELPEVKQTAIRPIDCLQEGYELIREQYGLMLGTTFIAWLIANAVSFLVGPMMCGLHLCHLDREEGKQTTFERVFKGFDYFMPSFLATLIYIAVYIAVVVPIVAAFVVVGIGFAERSEGLSVAVILAMYPLLLIVGLTITAGFTYTWALIVDRDLKAWDAVKTGWKAAWVNAPGTLGLVFLNGLLGIFSALLCFVPLIFALPIMGASVWIAYRRIFPRLEDAPTDPAAA